LAKVFVDEVLAPADSEAAAMSTITEATAGTAKAFRLHSAVLAGRTVLVPGAAARTTSTVAS
jgi:hypothetical protein